MIIAGYGGAFPGFNVGFGGSGGNIKANSPYILFMTISVFGYFGMLVTSAIMGSAVYRDFESRSHSLFYTMPVSKSQFLAGRFAGSFLVVLIVFSSMILGPLTASFMPFLDAEKLGSFNLLYYIQPFVTAVVPIVFITGTIFFSMSTLSRKIMPTYVSAVILLIGFMIAGTFINDIDNKLLASLLDPFGFEATSSLTRYWTVAEKNTLMVPLEGHLLFNRILWLAIAGGIGLVTFKQFNMTFHGPSSFRVSKPKIKESKTKHGSPELPDIEKDFSASAVSRNLVRLTFIETKGIIKNIYFIVIVLAGLLFLFSTASQIGKMYGTATYPVTYNVLSITSGSFYLFILIIITFYSGELVWKERETGISQITDSMPVPTFAIYLPKLISLCIIQILLLFIVMASGILIQLFKGYTHFELTQYVTTLFGIELIGFLFLCVLALLVQILVSHKYLGHFIMVTYYIASLSMGAFGLDHNLYIYGGHPGVVYSDLNGYGHFITPFIWFNLYWAWFAVILAVLSRILFVRGQEEGLLKRLSQFKSRASRTSTVTMAIAFILFSITGMVIFYNTNILNTYESRTERQKNRAAYEKMYKQYENIPQPRIVDVKADVDIFPAHRDVYIQGTYILKNKTNEEINELHILLNPEITLKSLNFTNIDKQKLDDRKNGYYIYTLSQPLMPHDTLLLTFETEFKTRGFKNSGSSTNIVYNGTFFNSFVYFPHIGYNASFELQDKDTRKENGLPEKERMADVNDVDARMNNYISNDADWVSFETVVSTDKGQTAIAPGYLQKDWIEGDRHFFHYKMDSKILNFYSWISADYHIKRDRWNDVNIEIYYHKGHEYNVDSMIDAIKKSLDYYTVQFSPYQHSQVRILEFPRYASFAQSFPNTIPFSESIGFIAKVDPEDEDDIDYPFYVTAHEMAHQWWAHQVIGGNVQGSTMLSESFCQYSALMVMEKKFGKEKMRKFLKFELDRYLSGRSMEREKELPLYKVENQSYIHYRKGSVVMYALRDYIGEENLNNALAEFISQTAWQEPPYTNSVEFLDIVRKYTPEKYQYIIKDMFETITLYDNKAMSAEAVKSDDGYQVTLKLNTAKMVADELGNEQPVQLSDWIDVGILGENGKELILEKMLFSENSTDIVLHVTDKPVKAGIDIYNKLIDRHSDDNMIEVVIK